MISFDNTTEKRIDATRIERRFCKCNRCKEATTVDFEIVCWSFPFHSNYLGKTVWEPRTETFRLDGESKVSVRGTYIIECPRCGALHPNNTRLKSTKLVEGHVCNDKCQKATSETCNCSCNGAQHGIKNKYEF